MELDSLFSTDMFMSELPDTLFSTLSSHQPASWPNPREIGMLLSFVVPCVGKACKVSQDSFCGSRILAKNFPRDKSY